MSKQHIVQQGECLSSIADQYGFRDYKLIYDHPENKEFKNKRPNPNIVFPGDELWIPDKTPKVESVDTDKSHTFRVVIKKRILRLRLLDSEGKPIANEDVVVTPSGKAPVNITTDSKGILEISVESSVKDADLMVHDRKLKIKLAHLNPVVDTPDKGLSGIQARLQNLGYYTGPFTEDVNVATKVAVSLFQKDMALDVDAELTPATIAKLIEEHGC